MSAALLFAPGEGRVCQFISDAARLITSLPRVSVNPWSRNSIGSSPAAAASSSVKLSTAKQLAGFPGERIGGRVFVAVHAVAPGAVEIDEPHFFLGQPKEARESLAIAVRALRRGPHRGRIAAHIGDRAGRANRTVALHRPEVTGAAARRAALRAWPLLPAGH